MVTEQRVTATFGVCTSTARRLHGPRYRRPTPRSKTAVYAARETRPSPWWSVQRISSVLTVHRSVLQKHVSTCLPHCCLPIISFQPMHSQSLLTRRCRRHVSAHFGTFGEKTSYISTYIDRVIPSQFSGHLSEWLCLLHLFDTCQWLQTAFSDRGACEVTRRVLEDLLILWCCCRLLTYDLQSPRRPSSARERYNHRTYVELVKFVQTSCPRLP